MKAKNTIVEQARTRFPAADSGLAALDLLASEIFEQLNFMQDKNCKEYSELTAKYHLVRTAYKFEFNSIIEQSSFERNI